jgi:hypothetical protein
LTILPVAPGFPVTAGIPTENWKLGSLIHDVLLPMGIFGGSLTYHVFLLIGIFVGS